MDRIIMVDGNNLLFRSYYATAYNGNFMKNSKGFPTNALFGFVNMMNKIIDDEVPSHIIVAFDKGKTFRHEFYKEYKARRLEMPTELGLQFPKAKELLNAMGIKYYEIDNYEADDIIGTVSKLCDREGYKGNIISSDKDLLQLISDNVGMKLLKSKDSIRYNLVTFRRDWGIEPIKIIDLKALMGDSSDNIPGVKGIGEKTALKLIQDYNSIDGVYEAINKLTPGVRKKLEEHKDDAYNSYKLATIYKNVPIEFSIDDLKYQGPTDKLNDIYRELEFYSMIKKDIVNSNNDKDNHNDIDYKEVTSDLVIKGIASYYIDVDNSNYHKGNITGIGIFDGETAYYVDKESIKYISNFLSNNTKFTYDLKKNIVSLKKIGYDVNNTQIDIMLAAYLLEYNLKDDISYVAMELGYDTNSSDNKMSTVLKAKMIYEVKDKLIDKLNKKGMLDLFNKIEMPLSVVLADMEITGFNVSSEILEEQGKKIKKRIDELSKEIQQIAGIEFNISSPSQLGNVLFEKLGLPHGKKTKTGYSTSQDVLEKLKGKHEIIEKIIEYRGLTKLYSAYIEGLTSSIYEDGKIHTIYTQTITRTGRLSSIEPNLQNIPIRSEEGRLIRKAFLPSKDSVILSSDYSQIELRVLSHMAHIESLIDAFNKGIDIHTKTASDIFGVDINEVTKDERRMAKGVNFGIIYGISSYGLSENLNITVSDAKKFIDDYHKTYPGVKEYMDSVISEARQNEYVKTLFGRIRTISEINNKNYLIRSAAERICLNTPIQGTAADIMKKAMIDVYNEFNNKNLKSKILVQVHDELVIDCKKDELDIVKSILKDKMINVYKLSVSLDVDINYGNDWYDAK